jgi:Ni2+-binding GTPase involved in maturation of urease and hydrogenase
MKLHLVGGFLGSGKTTAIIQSAKILMAESRSVGVITNDQGKYLVDTAFFRLENVPAVEVTGGCFCCNYDDLDSRLGQLVDSLHPDVVFAESVGSCADIVATVVRPLLALSTGGPRPNSFSVFTDGRMLRRRLLGQEMPFSEDVLYIYDKQIEEAGLVIINKSDLLSPAQVGEVQHLLERNHPGKPYLLQSSLSAAGVRPWLARIDTGELELPDAHLEIDYARYGAGEAQLAWLDEEMTLDLPEENPRARLVDLLRRILAAIENCGAGVGHLKFILSAGDLALKLSFPALEEPGWESRVPHVPGGKATLLVNARVEMPAEDLRGLLRKSLDESGLMYMIVDIQAFHPAMPRPTHRMH